MSARRTAVSLSLIPLLAACGAGSVNTPPPDLAAPTPDLTPPMPKAVRLVEGADLSVLATIGDAVLYGRGTRPAIEQTPWDALYRVPLAGGAPELLAERAYRAAWRRGGTDASDPALVVYARSQMEPPAVNSTLGDVYLARPGVAPQKLTLADPNLVVLPLLLSPDGRYLITHGRGLRSGVWAVDLTDLKTGTSRRLCWTLAAVVPRWLGFDGDGPPRLALRAIYPVRKPPEQDIPPDDATRIESALLTLETASDPQPLPDPAVGLLADGRLMTAGDTIQAVDATGKATQLSSGPVLEFSPFVAAGKPYFVRRDPNKNQGPLLRIESDGSTTTLVSPVLYVWSTTSTSAYVAQNSRANIYDLWHVPLMGGAAQKISDANAGFRRLPGGVLFFLSSDNAGLFRPGEPPQLLGEPYSPVLVVSGGRIAALRSADGALQLGTLDAPGGGLGSPLQTGVTTLDGTEREPQARGLVYAVATGADRGIFKQMLP